MPKTKNPKNPKRAPKRRHQAKTIAARDGFVATKGGIRLKYEPWGSRIIMSGGGLKAPVDFRADHSELRNAIPPREGARSNPKKKKATRIGRTKFSRRNPSLTYGHVPSFAAIRKAVGKEPFKMRLNDRDARVVERVGFEGGNRLDAHGVYELVELLAEEYARRGDDEAGDLASSILSVLGFEWV